MPLEALCREGSGRRRVLSSGLQSAEVPFGVQHPPEKRPQLRSHSSHSFTTNKSSKVTGFQTPQINFIFRLSADCSVRQLEEKLILGVSVRPADSRSRLRDKLLITVQGARAGRREQRSPWQAPGCSCQRQMCTEDPPWSLPACEVCRGLGLLE